MKIFKDVYYNIFVKIYRFFYIIGEKESPEIYSFSILSLVVFFNISSVFTFIEYKLHPNFSYRLSVPTIIVVYAINYFIFLHKSRHVQIVEKINISESKLMRYISAFLFISYAIFSLVILTHISSLVRELNIK